MRKMASKDMPFSKREEIFMLLTLENFTKSYGEKTLFSGVDFSIDDGERVGIVGVIGTG